MVLIDVVVYGKELVLKEPWKPLGEGPDGSYYERVLTSYVDLLSLKETNGFSIEGGTITKSGAIVGAWVPKTVGSGPSGERKVAFASAKQAIEWLLGIVQKRQVLSEEEIESLLDVLPV